MYAGREISRALAKGSLSEDDLGDSLDGLSAEELECLEAKALELTSKHDLVGQASVPLLTAYANLNTTGRRAGLSLSTFSSALGMFLPVLWFQGANQTSSGTTVVSSWLFSGFSHHQTIHQPGDNISDLTHQALPGTGVLNLRLNCSS